MVNTFEVKADGKAYIYHSDTKELVPEDAEPNMRLLLGFLSLS